MYQLNKKSLINILKGHKRGPHPFIVQLRDEETHRPLKGIKVGEIGPKLGMNVNDNGFLGFDHELEHIVFPEYVDEKCQSVIRWDFMSTLHKE